MYRILVPMALMALPTTGCMPDSSSRTPVRWEYRCIDAWGGVAHSSSELGKEGWEMAAAAGNADNVLWCFKRRIR